MRNWTIVGLAFLTSIVATQHASATAFAGGFGNSGATLWAGFSLTNRGSGSLEGLSYTVTPTLQSAFTITEGNASAIAATGGLGGLTGNAGRMNAIASIRAGAQAEAFGHAIAEVSQIVAFAILNTSDEQIIFDVRASYGINTGVYVDDILTESVLAYWNVGVRFDDPPYPYAYGEFGRTIDCSYPLSPSWACPNFYDSNDDSFGGRRFTLDPGDILEGEFITIARFEATAVPEPSTLALLAAAGFGLFTWRSKGRALRFIPVALAALTLAGCVSTYMKQFVGKDIREVMVADGPPVNAFDMGDGRRAFQWRIGGGSFVTPQTTTGTVSMIGNTAYLNATTIGGEVVSSSGCLVTYFARRDAARDAWIVQDISFPDRLVC